MNKLAIHALIFLSACMTPAVARENSTWNLESPSGNIQVNVLTGKKIYYRVVYKGQVVLSHSPVSVNVDGKQLGSDPHIASVEKNNVRQVITLLYGTASRIPDEYNELGIELKDGLTVIFRAYDCGMAYRLRLEGSGEVRIFDEEVKYMFPSYAHGWFPDEEDYETTWTYGSVFELDKQKRLPLPLLIRPLQENKAVKLVITEADLHAYPSLFLQKTNDLEIRLKGVFEKYPLSTEWGGFNNYSQMVTERADYMARLNENKNLPWRVMIITDRDEDLLHNTLVYRLSSPSALKDVSWIRPGHLAWDWWHDYNLENVDFRTGINTKTYLYHVDFAEKFGIPYINIDWKWTDAHDLFVMNPEVDVPCIIDYAAKRNVGVILWTPSHTLYSQLEEALDLFSGWGAAGVKVDFFSRDDQLANKMYGDIAREAARRKMVVNYHGCARPAGLERMYPNIINYEAVKGLEVSKWGTEITPEHDVLIPFIRQLAGPMDYTPGAMRNYPPEKFNVVYPPGSQGTRCHQLAMYVVYYMPLAMLCDMPTAYEAEPEYTELLTGIPTTWDESLPLKGETGRYAAIARRSGKDWYVGILNNSQQRQLDIDLSFLDEGKYRATIVTDNINADKVPWDYDREEKTVDRESVIPVILQEGGGAFIRMEK